MIRDFTKTMIRAGDRVVIDYFRDSSLPSTQMRRSYYENRIDTRASRKKGERVSMDGYVQRIRPRTLLIEQAYDWNTLRNSISAPVIDLVRLSHLVRITPTTVHSGVGRYAGDYGSDF